MKKIVILSGDPNSINSELIYKVWKKINKSIKKKIYLISNYDLLSKQFVISQCLKGFKFSFILFKITDFLL